MSGLWNVECDYCFRVLRGFVFNSLALFSFWFIWFAWMRYVAESFRKNSVDMRVILTLALWGYTAGEFSRAFDYRR